MPTQGNENPQLTPKVQPDDDPTSGTVTKGSGHGHSPSDGLSAEEVAKQREIHGANEVNVKSEPEWKKIGKRYLDWISLIIIATAVVSASIKNDGDRGWTSFVLLILELNLIVWVGYYSDRNAGNAVKELQELAASTAMCKRDGKWAMLAVKELVVGDLIQLKGGDVIPADARLEGPGEPIKVDESSLTGESAAVTCRPGDTILGGAVVAQGELDATITAVGSNTFFGKTIALLGAPQEQGHLLKVLNRVSVILALVSLVAVLIIFGVLVARGEGVGYAVIISCVVFVSVVPIGMPVVTTTVLAVGAREMANEKAIVSRLSCLEELSGMEILCSDKTGTLTLNKLSLDKADIEVANAADADEVLLMGALSAKWTNNDAIDKALTDAVGGDPRVIERYTIQKFIPFSPVDKKTAAHIITPSGEALIVTKGAPQIIGDMLSDPTEKQHVSAYIADRASRGLRSLGIARSADAGASWSLVGLVSLLDPPREDSMETIRRAQALGVEVKMVTGDQLAIAEETSKRLGLGTNIMEGAELLSNDNFKDLCEKVRQVDGFAGVFPEHKHRIVQALQSKGMLIGDGVNDAPALKKANVGIAVAGATAAAKGAADIILTEDGISTIITAIVHSRKIFRRLETYVIYRVASSLLILGFFFFGIIFLNLEWPSWALIVLSICNDLSAMAMSLDLVHSSNMPNTWNMTKCITTAFCIAAVNVLSTVVFLYLADIEYGNFWHLFNLSLDAELNPALKGITNGEVVACLFLAVLALTQLSILMTRNPSFWWRFGSKTAPPPSLWLVIPVLTFCAASTIIAVYWPRSLQPDGGRGSLEGAGWGPVGITWVIVIITFILSDLAKALVQMFFHRLAVVQEAHKLHGTPLPGWARVIASINAGASEFGSTFDDGLTALKDAVIHLFNTHAVSCRPITTEGIRREMALRLCFRDRHGNPSPSETAHPICRTKADPENEESTSTYTDSLTNPKHNAFKRDDVRNIFPLVGTGEEIVPAAPNAEPPV